MRGKQVYIEEQSLSGHLVSGEESLWQRDNGENGEMGRCIDAVFDNKGLLLSAEYSTCVNDNMNHRGGFR